MYRPEFSHKLMAPNLAGSLRIQSHPEYVIKVILHSMEGNEGENIILLNTNKTKFLRLKLNTSIAKDGDDIPWSMRQLKVYGQ